MNDLNDKPTIAFIGLGVMGAPMAKNLVDAGYDVVAHSRTASKVDTFEAKGGRAARSAAEAASHADIVVTMLPDSPDVEAVLRGPGGVFEGGREGQLIVDMSTIRPDVSRRLAAEASERGSAMLDAPVSGGEAGAIEGTLSIMVGGTSEAFAQARPVLDVLGTTVVLVGPNGAGQTVKAANQLIVAGNIQLLAEAMVFLGAAGVDIERSLRVLGGGLAGSTVLERKSAAMTIGEFKPGFRLALHHKDLGIVMDATRATGVVTPLGSVVAQLVAAMVARGEGDLDHSALIRLTSELSGRG